MKISISDSAILVDLSRQELMAYASKDITNDIRRELAGVLPLDEWQVLPLTAVYQEGHNCFHCADEIINIDGTKLEIRVE